MSNLIKMFVGCVLLNTSLSVIAAGGIGLGATRVIYPTQATKIPLLLRNTSEHHFLISSWVEDSKGEKTKDFIITPPLYVSKPKTENSLQIVKILDNFPSDREKIYYVNVKAVPSTKKEKLDGTSSLQLAVLSNIKLFVRPENLKPIDNIEDSVLIYKKNDEVYLKNPTPFYINITQAYINSSLVKQTIMLEPYTDFKLNQNNVKDFEFKVINDYGGFSKKVKLILND